MRSSTFAMNASSANGTGLTAPMPPRVKPRVTLTDALVILGDRQDAVAAMAIGKHEHRTFYAIEELLDDTVADDAPNMPPSISFSSRRASSSESTISTPFPAARPSALST